MKDAALEAQVSEATAVYAWMRSYRLCTLDTDIKLGDLEKS